MFGVRTAFSGDATGGFPILTSGPDTQVLALESCQCSLGCERCWK
jgi:hypothetical protein